MPNWSRNKPQSPIEDKMAVALDQAGIPYGCQYIVVYQNFSPFCRSRYPCRCGLRKKYSYNGEDELIQGERDDYDDSYQNCDWSVEGKTAPLYIVDFAIKVADGWIAIECDGKEFHSGDNAIRDLNRQREIEALGWTVIRFTGAEIYRDSTGCVERVKATIRRRLAPRE